MVDADSLLDPNGPITPVLFPGLQSNVLKVRLEGYIARAEADKRILAAPDSDTADLMTRALSLHYAFTDVYIRMSAQPLTISATDKGSHGYSIEQIRNMRALAEGYLAELIGLVPVISTAERPGTTSRPITFTW